MKNEKEIREGIIFLLSHELHESQFCGWDIEGIMDFFKLNKFEVKKEEMIKLLRKMEDEGLLEERHFLDKSVDYSIENPGMALFKNMSYPKLEKKWKFAY
jgi:hypothetical protein